VTLGLALATVNVPSEFGLVNVHARVEPTRFPSDHGGFLGAEYGQTGDPDAFAARLGEVLDG
jgi:hypothetical protein